jgi:uncharacterized integral membrane protein (TIGR00697 family)
MPQRVSMYFVAVSAVFVTTLIVANTIAVKLVPGPLGPVPAALLVFPISYIFGDILTEVYGYARARQVIWLGFGCNLLAVATYAIAVWLPGWGEAWSARQQEGFAMIFGAVPRILLASFVAYLFGEFANSFVLARMKVATGGRHLWARTIGSTLVGQALDSVVFIGLAFGLAWPVIIAQWLTKCLYEILATPLTYWIVGRLKRVEGLDPYDTATDFNPFRLADPAEQPS